MAYQEGQMGQEGRRDLAVGSTGELTLIDGWGNAAFTRGLLAGEKLETLARLIDALPPHSYAPSHPLPNGGFVVTVERAGEVLSYASGQGDSDAPAGLVELSLLFQQFGQEAGEPRTQPVAFRILEEGSGTAYPGPARLIIRNRDDLIRLLRQHRPDRPAAVPAIDFSRQLVVAEFLGTTSGGQWVTADGVEVTEDGFLRVRLQRIVPGPACPVATESATPFVLLAVDSRIVDILFAEPVVESQCP